ncbi:MAG: hypothetical protein K2X81_20245 [Candidatus Obscuribacterales bacterium]|nr:hypothetical protein [Candidatus Obscuribacterales bacterium]
MKRLVDSVEALDDLEWLVGFFENHSDLAQVGEICKAIKIARVKAQKLIDGNELTNIVYLRRPGHSLGDNPFLVTTEPEA